VNLTDIRAGLMANLATVQTVRVYSEWPDTPQFPAVCIISDDPYIEPYLTFTMSRVYLIVAVIVSKMPDVARAQQNLDRLLSSDLPTAVRGSDISLGGAAESVVWTGTSGLKEITIQGVGYLGHEMSVNVIVDT
jgi:hypothetical protein